MFLMERDAHCVYGAFRLDDESHILISSKYLSRAMRFIAWLKYDLHFNLLLDSLKGEKYVAGDVCYSDVSIVVRAVSAIDSCFYLHNFHILPEELGASEHVNRDVNPIGKCASEREQGRRSVS
ncbi:hypothetical protein TNIN_457341 [Trichonephila inaurata madagascariensis]|uniref:Uncharacterized protein n=1 Tax=Trichonephila inaurata madagascariensis TaxID=2747483 RepID=A0A8X6X4G9_9ARAC|nr:hypothetical protein TNIN_457341 [Trichonephila inaurata madagascariensis]